MRRFFRILACILTVLSAMIFAAAFYGEASIPDSDILYGNSICYNGMFYAKPHATDTVSTDSQPSSSGCEAQLKLMNVIPVKEVTLKQAQRRYVCAGGELIGIRLSTDGIEVVATESFETETGTSSPAEAAGIRAGDILLEANGVKLLCNEDFTEIIKRNDGSPIRLTVQRKEKNFTTDITPARSRTSGNYKCGIWIRDSVGGIGTLTYSDASTGTIAALGHGIYDNETNLLLPASHGRITSACVSAVEKGLPGKAGQICGISSGTEYGCIETNTEKGVYGGLTSVFTQGGVYPVAFIPEVHPGQAQIICTVADGGKRYYDVEIEKTGSVSENGKDMILRITDPALLSATGGIVQGMSGSPIIQDGMLAGAVTHVFLNDPKRGYGIYAQEMLDLSDTVSPMLKKAS